MSTESHVSSPAARTNVVWEVLRVVVLAALAIDAYVHFHLAPDFDGLKGSGSFAVSQGQLFRLEAVAAIVAGVLLLVVKSRIAAAFAFMVLAGGVSAVLLYAYVDIGEIGPLPAMYDPTWYGEKTLSAIAEGIGAAAALLLALRPARRRADVA